MKEIILPNIEDTQDPIIKQLIVAVQELADQVSSHDTVMLQRMEDGFGSVRTEIKDLGDKFNSDIKNLGDRLDSDMKEQTVLLQQLVKLAEDKW